MKATEIPILMVDRILVVLKATVDRNVNSQSWQDFGSSGSYVYEFQELTGSIASSRYLVALKATRMSALKFNRILIVLKATVID